VIVWREGGRESIQRKSDTYDTLVLEIDLVAEHDERKVLGIARTGLDEELVAPAVEVLEGLGDVDVEHEHAAVGTAIECNAEALESLLAGSIPDLQPVCKDERSLSQR